MHLGGDEDENIDNLLGGTEGGAGTPPADGTSPVEGASAGDNAPQAPSPSRRKKPIAHLKRVRTEIHVAGPNPHTLWGWITMSEVFTTGLRLFASEELIKDTPVVIKIVDTTNPIELKGVVNWCQRQATNTKILQKDPCPFRVEILYKADSPDEQNKYQSELFSRFAA